ncbi:hypothetical protein MD484_g4860, partial [Candolleomyces efflorescens]
MLPDLPLELWHRILNFTCTEDSDFSCAPSLALSRTCHTLHHVSRYHRFHSVTLRGWKQLCAFEEYFKSNKKPPGSPEEGLAVGHGGIVHLNIKIENLWVVAYPEHEDKGDESDTSDDSYILSGSEDGDEDHVDDDGEDDGRGSFIEGEGDQTDEERLEFSELSELEAQELAYDAADLAKDELGPLPSLADGSPQVLSSLLDGRPTAISRVEFRVYSALRRLLEACAPTLQVLTLSWIPIRTFFPEAVIPVLPTLRVLRWSWRQHDYHHRFPELSASARGADIPILFPTLQRLEVQLKTEVDRGVVRLLKDLVRFGPGFRTLVLPDDFLWYVLESDLSGLVRLMNPVFASRGFDIPIKNKQVRVLVESGWTRSVGLLSDVEVQGLGVLNLENEYYADPGSTSAHFAILVKQLAHEARRMSHESVRGIKDPNLQYGIDVCTELMTRFRSS